MLRSIDEAAGLDGAIWVPWGGPMARCLQKDAWFRTPGPIDTFLLAGLLFRWLSFVNGCVFPPRCRTAWLLEAVGAARDRHKLHRVYAAGHVLMLKLLKCEVSFFTSASRPLHDEQRGTRGPCQQHHPKYGPGTQESTTGPYTPLHRTYAELAPPCTTPLLPMPQTDSKAGDAGARCCAMQWAAQAHGSVASYTPGISQPQGP